MVPLIRLLLSRKGAAFVDRYLWRVGLAFIAVVAIVSAIVQAVK